MVKGHSLYLMEESMWGNLRMEKGGREQNTTNTETSL